MTDSGPSTHRPLPTPPRPSPWRRALTLLLLLACAAVLVGSYRQTKISPGLLWSNRSKAVEFIFGRTPTDAEREDARRQAERFPAMLATEQARTEIKEERRAKGELLLSDAKFTKDVQARADGILAAETPEQRNAVVEKEYRKALGDLRGGFFPPDLRSEHLRGYFDALLDTLAIALWGTLLAVVLAIPLAVLGARTTLEILAPGESFRHRSLRWVSRVIVRRFLDVCRGFNEFVLALVFVAVIGLGPFTGVLALFVHSTGILAKVFSEAIDAVDRGPIEGIASTGARPLQTVSLAVFPQVMPYFVSNGLLRFETNVRSATVLGVVGAGGIGFLMSDKINGYQYREVCTIMIIVLLTVTLVDTACTRLMRRFL